MEGARQILTKAVPTKFQAMAAIATASDGNQNHRNISSPPTLSADEIILLAENPSATLPQSFSSSSLLDLLRSPPPLLFSSLLSLISRSPLCSSSLIATVLLSFLRLFFARQLPHDLDSPRLFHLFFPLLSHIDLTHLPALLDFISSHLSSIFSADDAQILDLLPHLLDLAAADGKLINDFLEKLLSINWSKALLIKMCSLIRDCPAIYRLRVSEFLPKIFDGMRNADIQDLPSLVFQLLLFASKGINSVFRKQMLADLLKFFGEPMKGSTFVVRQVDATVLMHVNFAVKQDPSLGSEFLSVVRSDLRTFNHFAAAVLLSLARIRRFNEKAIGVLKSVFLGSRQDFIFARNCKWLPDRTKEDLLQTAKRIEKALVRAINESTSGREHLVPSLLQFGFIMLELVDGEKCEVSCTSDGLMSCEEIGIQTLKTLFEVHEMAQNQVIEQCKSRILSLTPQQSSSAIKLLGNLVKDKPYLILEHVARLKELLDFFTFMHNKTSISLVDAILPLIKFSKDLQDYIILVIRKAMFRQEYDVRVAAATSIIDLIIIDKNRLKKNGLNCLQDSSSQASCSQQAGLLNRMEGCLFQELNGLLRRSLSQQVTVRETVYKGLLKLVMLNPAISGHVFDFLWPHFLRFCSLDAEYPLMLDACYVMEKGNVSQIEPLDHLLSCVSWIVLLQKRGRPDHQPEHSIPFFALTLSQEDEEQGSRVSSGELFRNALSKIRKTLSKWTFEGGFKQKEASVSHSFKVEKFDRYGLLLLGILEVFINLAVTELDIAAHEDAVLIQKEILLLVDSYIYVEESGLIKRESGIRRGASKTSIQPKSGHELKDPPHTSQLKLIPVRGPLLATSSICKLLNLAANSYKVSSFSNQTTSLNSSQTSMCKTLDQCLKLISFSMKACIQHLKSTTSIGDRSSNDPYIVTVYGDFKQLAPPLLQLIWLLGSGAKVDNNTKMKESTANKKYENKGSELHQALLCLIELFRLSPSKVYLTELIEVLNSLDISEWNLGSQVEAADGMNHRQIPTNYDPYDAFLDKIIKPLYSGFLARSHFKETVAVSELFLIIWRNLPFEQRKQHGVWMLEVCKDRKMVNPKTTQNLIATALHLMPSPKDLTSAQDIASELLQVMGSEEKNPIEISRTFPFVNSSTKNCVFAALIQVVESCIADLDWSVAKLKVISNFSQMLDPSAGCDHQFPERPLGLILEEATHSRSETLVYVLTFFAEMNLKDSQADHFLKLTAKLYKLFARMAKLRIAPKGCKQLIPGLKFERLAEITCGKLTSKLYSFVALVQRNQQENVRSRGIINKIKRENKCIPDLIFQIEDYERYLIQLSKLTRINLLRNAKRSTVRDFKILEMKKAAAREEEMEQEPDQIKSKLSSKNDCGDESDETNSAENGAAEDSGSGEDVDSVIRIKKAKTIEVVCASEDEEVL